MITLLEKKELIFNYEEQFANAIAAKVIDKPILSLWMILIPVFFVFYFYKLKQFADGRKAFVKHFMVTRQRILDEAFAAVESDRKPDVNEVIKMSSAPEDTFRAYAQWIKVLAEHYLDLLKAQGDHIDSLVKATYKNRTNYLLTLNRLNEVEKGFNNALKPHLYKNIESVDDIVAVIEQWVCKIRRQEAARIFP